ncbi:hypothetical protein B0H14DRAFT_3471260 [Mycena olivaceomarginata]|nr:hypothetical protein B0H14DRAFT_3471260 [Mycena olivaceomarginata]
MVPPNWTTSDQSTLLQSFMADFLRRQEENKLHHFWPTVYNTWFSRFPQQQPLELPLPSDPMARTLTDEELKTLGKAIIEQKKQLQNWFCNKCSKIGAANPVDQSAAAFKLESVIAALLDVQPQAKKRARQTIQVFQTRNREAIRARLTDEGYDQIPERDDEEDDWTDESDGSEAARLKATRAERMRLHTRVVTAMWKEASAEERAAVAAQVDQENKELRQAELNAEQESTAPKTPAQLQDGIDALDALFTKVHGAAHRALNFVHPDMRPACFCKVWPTTSPRRCPLSPLRSRPLSPPRRCPLSPPARSPVVTPAPPLVVTPAPPLVVTPAPPPVVTPAPPPVVPALPPVVFTAPIVTAAQASAAVAAPAKRRGRPPKAATALADATNVTNTAEGGSDGQGVVVYCHGVGDNRKAARAAAAQAKAAERKAAAEALAAQCAKGWMHSPDGSVVLLRARKPACNPNGSARDCKGIHAPQLDETEKAMLARADSVRAENEILKGKKRKALAASAAPTVAKKRRTGA